MNSTTLRDRPGTSSPDLGPAGALKSIAVHGEPPWDEHARVVVYTGGSDFAGEQVFDIPVHYFHEPYDPEDPQGPRHEIVEAATHWVLRDDFVGAVVPAQGSVAAKPSVNPDAAAVAAWKWGYEYLQSRMESIGREGWAHDCDSEIADRIARGVISPRGPGGDA